MYQGKVNCFCRSVGIRASTVQELEFWKSYWQLVCKGYYFCNWVSLSDLANAIYVRIMTHACTTKHPCWPVQTHMRSCKISEDNSRSQKIVKDCAISQRIIQDLNRSRKISKDHTRSQKITQELERSHKISKYHPRTRKIMQDLKRSCKISKDRTRFQ